MKSMEWRVWNQFRAVLGALSIEEIISNKQLIRRAEMINSFFTSKAA